MAIKPFEHQINRHFSNTIITQGELSNVIILSVSDRVNRARVKTLWLPLANRPSMLLPDHWDIITSALEQLTLKFDNPITDIRIEWVTSQRKLTWAALKTELKQFKRNYYRSGIALEGKREPWLLLTEMELNANACLYLSNKIGHAGVNDKNLKRYLKARHGSSQIPEFKDDLTVIVFNTAGVYIDCTEDKLYLLDAQPRTKGHRELLPLQEDITLDIISKSTAYLAKQVKSSGQYEYGYFPCFNRTIDAYNNLRHASSTYALIEGYESCKNNATADSAQLGQIAKQVASALNYLITHHIRTYTNNLAYVTEANGEIKLGANAVAILAMVKYTQVFEDNRYLPLMEKLANGILAMQQDNGRFVHVLHADTLKLKAETRIIYYDGEAAFALMRLYGLTKDERWLSCVIKAFDYFIEARHDRAHDHWLSYCSNELVKYRPEKKYFQFAVNNVQGYTHFIKTRITTFPTLLELSMAFHKMLLKLDEYPQFHDVLDGFDIQDFYQALHARANYLMNGFFFPEIAMFFKSPQTILHGFFIRHHTFRVRIDDVEHYLSGLIAYAELLKDNRYPKLAAREYQPALLSNCNSQGLLTEHALAEVTKGRWIVKPKNNWSATGVCIWAPSFKPGHLIVARNKETKRGGLAKSAIESLVIKGASAILTEDASAYQDMNTPILLVDNLQEAILSIGRLARHAFQGNVLGVTGSAGKTTTVAMLSHLLSQQASVDMTKFSANLPVGIAWNMASMQPDAKYWVLEMAIGNMMVNSELVRPNVAFITNIAPSHLEYHHSLENIAIKKSRIFDGMLPGSIAVLNRDMPYYELIKNQAGLRGLKVITFGQHQEATVRLKSNPCTPENSEGNVQENQIVTIEIDQQSYPIKMQAPGQHMLLNAAAIIAFSHATGLDINRCIKQLQSFQPVAGRGNKQSLTYNDKDIVVYNEAYNANPLSMQAALTTFAELNVAQQHKLLIIGDMLELGVESRSYHQQLALNIAKIPVREIILVGACVKDVYTTLKSQAIKVHHFDTTDELILALDNYIKTADHILVKASNSIGLNNLFNLQR